MVRRSGSLSSHSSYIQEIKYVLGLEGTLPISGAPLMAIVAVIVIMALVGAGLWLKRK